MKKKNTADDVSAQKIKYRHATLAVSLLETNSGQIDGLPRNPRLIKGEKFKALKKSVSDDPDMMEIRPVVVVPHGEKFVILGGNMRTEAARANGQETVPCIVIDEDTPLEWMREFVLKDNGDFGEWDWDMLANEWDDMDFATLGVDVQKIKMVEPNTAQEDNFDEDKASITVRCKRGDVWQLGEHRLMCGDSIDLEDVKILMGGGIVDLFITDPPYNVNYKGGTKDELTIKNDNLSDADFTQFLTDAFISANSFMKCGAPFYLWHSGSSRQNFLAAMNTVGWQERQTLIWNKNHFVLGRSDYQWKHEPCLYGWKDGAPHYFTESRSETSVLDFDRPTRNGEHPTMKPVELIGYIMKNSSRKGESVLDLFGGSGTTLIAAEQLNRKCYMMELDEHYCDVILARWEKMTEIEPKRIEL